VNGGNIANIAIDIIVDALAPSLVEGAEVSGSLFGKAITITEDGGYEDLVVDFTATNTIKVVVNLVPSTTTSTASLKVGVTVLAMVPTTVPS
jgi:hypothetical protein